MPRVSIGAKCVCIRRTFPVCKTRVCHPPVEQPEHSHSTLNQALQCPLYPSQSCSAHTLAVLLSLSGPTAGLWDSRSKQNPALHWHIAASTVQSFCISPCLSPQGLPNNLQIVYFRHRSKCRYRWCRSRPYTALPGIHEGSAPKMHSDSNPLYKTTQYLPRTSHNLPCPFFVCAMCVCVHA